MDRKFYTISSEMARNPTAHKYPGFTVYFQGDGVPYIGTADSLKTECCIESTYRDLYDASMASPTALYDQSILLYLINGEG
jgi:hypothetical protein